MNLRHGVTAIALAALLPSAVSAQTSLAGSLFELHGVTQQNIMATAEDLSQEMYDFRPTAEVRSTGEMLAHIAGAQFMFCSMAAGEENPNGENFEETRTTRADIVDALSAGFDYCAGVYNGMTDADAAAERTIPFMPQTPMTAASVLAFNSAHNYEHYGNLVTYMRLNGIVPPSSR
ncbi:MAG TPA: DinB family protein [Longimicrobiales bacterium]|nr:DinB family protein [Longimicrobiales bacterium]